jgi:hypothetical protein
MWVSPSIQPWPSPTLSCPAGGPLKTASRPFQGWPPHSAGGLWPFSALLDTPRCMPMPGGTQHNELKEFLFWYKIILGKFHDQGDAEWIVIRRQLRGQNDTPFRRPTPGRPIGRPGVGRPLGVVGVFSYY